MKIFERIVCSIAVVVGAFVLSLVINFIPATVFWLILDVALNLGIGYWEIYWVLYLIVCLINLVRTN